jgi:hypothetical protein
MVVNTCALYGAADYANSWIGINLLVVLISLTAVAVVYTISRLLPGHARGRVVEATRFEITQAILSLLIIAVLIGSAQMTCNLSASLGKYLLASGVLPSVSAPGIAVIPASYANLSPFQYADYYIGTLATQTGIGLLTAIYSANISLSIQSEIYNSMTGLLKGLFSGEANLCSWATLFSFEYKCTLSWPLNFGYSIRLLAENYNVVLGPLATMIVGALFLQYIGLPLLQYTAFVVILPVALAMRSISFAGFKLRETSNAVLAIAIAAYLIYPMTVMLDSYMMYWMFSPTCFGSQQACNPALPYLDYAYAPTALPLNLFFSSSQTTPVGSVKNAYTLFTNAISSFNFVTLINPLTAEAQSETLINNMAMLAFQGIILFALNAAITIGFAMGLAKALSGGVEGAGSFWSNI